MNPDERPVIKLSRDSCGEFEPATSRDWLMTNGIGGYASGTISGVRTRRYDSNFGNSTQFYYSRVSNIAEVESLRCCESIEIRIDTWDV